MAGYNEHSAEHTRAKYDDEVQSMGKINNSMRNQIHSCKTYGERHNFKWKISFVKQYNIVDDGRDCTMYVKGKLDFFRENYIQKNR